MTVLPRGGMVSSPRATTATRADRGRPSSRTAEPAIAWSGATSKSIRSRELSAPTSSGGAIARRREGDHLELLGDPFQGRSLDERRDHDDEEDGVEDGLAVLHVLGEDDRPEHDRDGAAQPGPAQQRPLAGVEAAPGRRDPDCHRPDQEHEQCRERQPGESDGTEIAGEDEQPEHDEHHHLRDEGEPFVELDQIPAEPRRGAAHGEPDQVDGQEAAAAAHVGDPERERPRGDRGDRRERPDRVGQARERPGRDDAERDPDHQAEAELAEEQQAEIGDPVVRLLDPVDQTDGQRDRHRVVAAGLRLERAGEATPDVGEAHRREHRRRVGRRHDRAEEDRLEPGEVEQGVGREPGQQRRHHHADRRQQGRRDRDFAQPPPRGGEAALEEDRRQRHHAHLPGELGVVELDSTQAVGAEQHPEPEERDQRGHAGTRRAESHDDARRQHAADDQEDQALVHGPILSGIPAPGATPRLDLSTGVPDTIGSIPTECHGSAHSRRNGPDRVTVFRRGSGYAWFTRSRMSFAVALVNGSAKRKA